MSNPKKILIVDDEEMITEVIKSYLEQTGYSVFVEHNGKKGLEAFFKINPELIILDLMLPDLSGEEICTAVRKKSRIPIIMLTAKVGEDEILEGLDIGADDYITKPFSVRELVGRVKAVLRRIENDPQPLFNIMSFNEGDLKIDTIKGEVTKAGEIVRLTPNEYKILLTLLKHPSKVFTRDELIEIALGEDYEGFSRTIDTHIKNLRQKIESDIKNPEYILTVRGLGYKFGGDANEL